MANGLFALDGDMSLQNVSTFKRIQITWNSIRALHTCNLRGYFATHIKPLIGAIPNYRSSCDSFLQQVLSIHPLAAWKLLSNCYSGAMI